MKNKKVVALVATAAILANLALAAVASASSFTGSEKTEQEIGSGSIAIHEVPNAAALTMPDITAAQVLGTAFTNSVNNPGGAGWSVVWSDTRYTSTALSLAVNLDGNFVSGVNNFDKSNMWLQDNGSVSKVTGITDCTGYTPQATWGSIGAAGFALYSESAEARYEKCHAEPDFRVVIPMNQPIGVYTTTMTFTIS